MSATSRKTRTASTMDDDALAAQRQETADEMAALRAELRAASMQQVVVAPQQQMSFAERLAASRTATVEAKVQEFQGKASTAALAAMAKKLEADAKRDEDNTKMTPCAACNTPLTAKDWRESEEATMSTCVYTRFCNRECAIEAYTDECMFRNMRAALIIIADPDLVLVKPRAIPAILLQVPESEAAAPRRAAPREATPPASRRKCRYGRNCKNARCQLDHN